MAVTVGAEVLSLYSRFSLYNSPYVAHEEGRAIDLYPPAAVAGHESVDEETDPDSDVAVVSPVSGTVIETRTVSAPPKPFATAEDHLLVVDTGDAIARILHVEPAVGAGDTVSRGEPLGRLVRSGFFAPWVPNHVHLGFRSPDADYYRASGSVPIEVGVDLTPLDWDGSGTVVASGDTWARLDAPAHPTPGEGFVGLGSNGGVLDGGFPHYAGGGLLGDGAIASIAGTRIGDVSGRTVTWLPERTVLANGSPVTGLSLYCGRDTFGVKLVGDLDLSVGADVSVAIGREAQDD